MIHADQNSSWLEQHSNAPLTKREPKWLSGLRALALERFEQVGLPGVRDEQWRYTNLRALKSMEYAMPEASNAKVSIANSANPRLVFVDGVFQSALSDIESISANVQLLSLDQALADNSDPLQPVFGSTLPAEQHGFTALNTAYCRDGYVLILADAAVATDTLEILFQNSEHSDQQAAVIHTRNLIIAGANSQCTVIERHVGPDGSVYLSNSITEIIAADNAHIEHYKIQQESADAFHMGGVFVNLSSNAQVKTHSVALNGLVTRNDVAANLSGQGAHIEMNGLVVGQGRQHIDNHTQVSHLVPNCSSDEFYRTILDGHSRSVFRGRIVVAQDAQLSNADQRNNNLLLSEHAEADTLPQLEIYADDVKCSHGATVGQLDAKALFYLQSRGIDRASANALLTFAFANELIERFQLDSVRNELTGLIAGTLLSDMEGLL